MGGKLSSDLKYQDLPNIPQHWKEYMEEKKKEGIDGLWDVINNPLLTEQAKKMNIFAGVYGIVYILGDKVLKKQKHHPIHSLYEYELQQRAAQAGLAPPIEAAYKDESGNIYFLMPKIEMADLTKINSPFNPIFDPEIDDKLRENTKAFSRDALMLMRNLHKINIYHGDLHPGNIGYMDGKMVAIDFGLSQTRNEYENADVSNQLYKDYSQIASTYIKLMGGKDLDRSARMRDTIQRQQYEIGVKTGDMRTLNLRSMMKGVSQRIALALRQPQRYPYYLLYYGIQPTLMYVQYKLMKNIKPPPNQQDQFQMFLKQNRSLTPKHHRFSKL